MKIPLPWLQTYVKPSLPIQRLADALSLTSIGTTLDGFDVLDLEVTFNRGDLLSVLGVAREVATICKNPLSYRPTPEKSFAWKKQSVSSLSVEIHDKKLCPFYALAKIEGVKLSFSPKEIQENLKKAGMRPINSLVDITNYIMLGFGQPLHAFDATKVTDEEIHVRKATSNEKITTLDGKERILQKDMLLICDAKKPVAVAGVMGGEDSEVSGKTTTILLEAAIFDPISIRGTARTLGLRSEASSRFGHGLTEENLKQALHKAITLYETLAGGRLTAYKEVGSKKAKRYEVLVPESKVIQLLGETVPMNEATELLKRLGCEVKTARNKKGYTLSVTPPYWRSDLIFSADIVEEIARMRGYEKIQGELPVGNVPPQRKDPLIELIKDVKLALVGCGYDEMNSPSFLSADDLRKIGVKESQAVRLTNPMSKEQEYLQTTGLIQGLHAVSQNRKHTSFLQLFEIGRIFTPKEDSLPLQPYELCVLHVGEEGEKALLTLKKDVLTLFDFVHVKDTLRFETKDGHPYSHFFHPGRSACLVLKKSVLGYIGELHPAITESFGIKGRMYGALIAIEELLPHIALAVTYKPIPMYPPLIEDITVTTPPTLSFQMLLDEISSVSQLIQKVELVGRYKDAKTIQISYQHPRKSLTDATVAKIRKTIIQRLENIRGVTVKRIKEEKEL